MPHAFAGSLQKAGRIVERRPVEEADIHMSTEGIDVAERRVSHARRGMAVVQKLANVRAATTHPLEPRLTDPSQLVVGLGEPGVDAGVSPDGGRETEEFAHGIRAALYLANFSLRMIEDTVRATPGARPMRSRRASMRAGVSVSIMAMRS